MEVSIPAWLSNSLLTEALRKEEGKANIVVTNYTATPAAPAGNNYGSCILRVRTEYKVGEDSDTVKYISFVIKSTTTDDVVLEAFGEFEDVEPIFYSTFLSEARTFDVMTFIPKSFYSTSQSVTILEDLNENGYLMADRVKRLDFDHCKLYFVHAATLHAVSVAVHKKQPKLLQSMGKEKMFSNEVKVAETFKIMIRLGLKCFAERVKKISRFDRYAAPINAVSGKLWDMLVEAYKPSEVIQTINQGDPWTTNMMFKYDDEGKVCGIKLLDFQMLRYGSPVNDLVFFIWTSANHEAKQKLDELYHLYVDTFNGKLEDFNCTERLRYKDIMDNVKKLSCFALFTAASFSPLFYDPEPIDFKIFITPDNSEMVNPYERYYSEDYCTNELPDLLADLESAGVFDYLAR